jgi:ubiquinol-cytochrome c reductase iron-sulfur subunit
VTSVRAKAWWIGVSFVVSALASIGLTIVYALGGQVQVEGALLGLALGGLSLGLIGWARVFLPHGPFTQSREEELAQPVSTAEAEASFEAGAEPIERRRFLTRLMGAAVAALGIAAVFPIRSLGTRPGRSLRRTAWGPGSYVVTSEGERVRANDVAVNSVLTVFPEGFTDAADSQTILIRLPEGVYRPAAGREDWSPRGFVAFSKVCTHAGCPVGLYAAQTHQLFCPCHQSAFDVLRAAQPVAGPATRPLPQLPLDIDDKGYLVAQRDFIEPVGPGFWSRGRG